MTPDSSSAGLLDRIADGIRRNEVVLWTGAGFNWDAGLPTGKQLADVIRSRCSAEERQRLEGFGGMLPDVAEEFVQMRGGSRNELLSILRAELRPADPSLDTHRLLLDIPQLKYVVTTNYDDLLERVFGSEIEPVVSDPDVALMSDRKTAYLKVHGDLMRADPPLVITRSDYTSWFGNAPRSPLWSSVNHLVSRFSVLFVGYSLGDQNVAFVLDQMMKALGSLAKESFLVSPDIPDYKVRHLGRSNVTAVKATAAEALSHIRGRILDHLLVDAQDGLVEPPKAAAILQRARGLGVEFDVRGTKYRVRRFTSFGGDSMRMDVRMDFDPAKEGAIIDRGAETRAPEIDAKPGDLKGLEIRVGGTILPTDPAEEMGIRVIREKTYDGRVLANDRYVDAKMTVKPVDDGFCLSWETESFRIEGACYRLGQGDAAASSPAKFIPKIAADPAKGLAGVELFRWVAAGGAAVFMSDDAAIMLTLPRLGDFKSDQWDVDSWAGWCDQFYRDVLKVSLHYGIVIRLPAEITDTAWGAFLKALAAVEGTSTSLEEIVVTMRVTDGFDPDVLPSTPSTIRIANGLEEKVDVFGREVSIGHMSVETLDGFVENLDETRERFGRGDRELPLRIRSAGNGIHIRHERKP